MKQPTAKAKALAAVCATCLAFSGYIYSERSMDNLVETRPELQQVSHCALSRSSVDFVVIDGGRTEQEHKKNVENGKSWVRRSRHQDGLAIDYAALVNGTITYQPEYYYQIAGAFYRCSDDLGIPITWGGEWKAQDLMHIELDRRYYP